MYEYFNVKSFLSKSLVSMCNLGTFLPMKTVLNRINMVSPEEIFLVVLGPKVLKKVGVEPHDARSLLMLQIRDGKGLKDVVKTRWGL